MKTKIVVTSLNPVKIKVVERVFGVLLPDLDFVIIPLDLEKNSGEPFGREETLKLARDSIIQAVKIESEAKYYFSMEGGIEENTHSIDEVAYVVVRDSEGEEGVSRAVSFPIPKDIFERVKTGQDFGGAVDSYFKVKNTKTTGGYINILTNGSINKEELYFQPTIVALSRILNKGWYR